MITLVFSACVAGQLVPCGCSPDQRGGLPRAVALVEKMRQRDPGLLFIDAGDLLFENPQRPPAQMLTQRQLKARALARGDELMQAAARGVGERDLTLGPQFAQETAGKVPLLAPGQSLLVREVGILAAAEPNDFAAAPELRKKGAKLVVALLHPRGDNAWTRAQAMLLQAREAGIDLAVLGRRDDPAVDGNLKEAGPPPLLAIEGHMQSLLRVEVHPGTGPLQLLPSAADRDAEVHGLQVRIERFRAQIELYPQRKAQLEQKIAELEGRQKGLGAEAPARPPPGAAWADAAFVPVTQEVGTVAAAQKLVDAYDEKVSEMNLAEAKTQPEACPAAARGELSYVGANKCAECHEAEAQFWQQTKHAEAWQTLVTVRKQLSLDCVRCHVTGWQQSGGVCRIDRTAAGEPGFNGHAVGRQDVQCEACHGPGSEHAVDDTGGHIKAEVTETVCMRCHEAANSPHFEYTKYKPFIVGPGHGEPLARGQEPKPRPGGPPQ
ncbi:MAG TPA: multiheme c-type cytochrome [Myxococcales bacterium]|nr:multiheme c-type cytochrome [Myxococcales bacterium]